MVKVLEEFKKFAMRGNVIDMAIGIIIGAAFGKIVDSLVKDVIMPPLGILLGKINFSNWFFVLKDGSKVASPYESLEAAQAAGATTMNIGQFLNSVISFIIVAFAVFMLVKAMNKLQDALDRKEESDIKKAETAVQKTTKACPYCLSEIKLEATRCAFCTSELKNKK